MFDIGFWELSIIGVVALIVIGPERLPGVARTAGFWFGRVRRFVSTVKADIDRELKAEELQKVLKQQADGAGIHEILEETKDAVESASKETKEAVESLENETKEAVESLESENEYLVKSDRFEQSDDVFDDFDDYDDDEPVATAKSTEDKLQNDNKKPLETVVNSENKPQDDDNKA
jgi:sec-independent protein translocase protein TatB